MASSSTTTISLFEVPDNNLLDLSDRLTISAWIYPTSLPSGGGLHTIVSKDTNYEFHLDSSGRLYWWWEESNTNWRSLTSSTSTLNEWTFVTVRYRTNGNNTRAQIYINGNVEPLPIVVGIVFLIPMQGR